MGWQKNDYQPLYLQQNKLNISNEKMILMLNVWENKIKKLNSNWLESYENNFKIRFLALLNGSFRCLTPATAISILDPKLDLTKKQLNNKNQNDSIFFKTNQKRISVYDIRRLELYSNYSLDLFSVLDLIPDLAKAYFTARFPINLCFIEMAVLICVGLQNIDLTDVQILLDIPENQVLNILNKIVTKLAKVLVI